ncbi:hypothetical protein MJM99_32620, partial [Salmonella enterica subsp. enterica serovar Kentucky]|nr:hypothetical protein [Salmonella enterica subsp. enterica serovar Kentucky]
HALFTDESRPSLILAHGGREMSDSFRQSIWQPTENIAEDYARVDGDNALVINEGNQTISGGAVGTRIDGDDAHITNTGDIAVDGA